MHTVFTTLSCNVTGTLQGNIPIHSVKVPGGVSFHLAEATWDSTVEPYSESSELYPEALVVKEHIVSWGH